jgi:hypothetical protein
MPDIDNRFLKPPVLGYNDQPQLTQVKPDTPSQDDLQKMIMQIMMDRTQVDPGKLDPDGQSQWDTVQRFLQMMHEHMQGNPELAGISGNKALTMLDVLKRQSPRPALSANGVNGPATVKQLSERERIQNEMGPYYPFNTFLDGESLRGSRNPDSDRPYLAPIRATETTGPGWPSGKWNIPSELYRLLDIQLKPQQ